MYMHICIYNVRLSICIPYIIRFRSCTASVLCSKPWSTCAPVPSPPKRRWSRCAPPPGRGGTRSKRRTPSKWSECRDMEMDMAILRLGVSENSVPLNPMVLLIIIPIKWLFFLGIYPIFRQTHWEGGENERTWGSWIYIFFFGRGTRIGWIYNYIHIWLIF